MTDNQNCMKSLIYKINIGLGELLIENLQEYVHKWIWKIKSSIFRVKKKRIESLNKIQRKEKKKNKRVPNSRYLIFAYYIPRNLLWGVFVDFFQPAVSQPCSFLNFNLNDSLLAQLHRKVVRITDRCAYFGRSFDAIIVFFLYCSLFTILSVPLFIMRNYVK